MHGAEGNRGFLSSWHVGDVVLCVGGSVNRGFSLHLSLAVFYRSRPMFVFSISAQLRHQGLTRVMRSSISGFDQYQK